jgi:hypothetical protein
VVVLVAYHDQLLYLDQVHSYQPYQVHEQFQLPV